MIPTRDTDNVLACDARPAGDSGECFYCQQKLGAQHAPGCVILQRYVVVRMEVEYVVPVPRDWDQEAIQFQRNLGTWCAANDLRALAKATEGDPGAHENCGCGCTRFDYRREATSEDFRSLLVLHDPDEGRKPGSAS